MRNLTFTHFLLFFLQAKKPNDSNKKTQGRNRAAGKEGKEQKWEVEEALNFSFHFSFPLLRVASEPASFLIARIYGLGMDVKMAKN